MFEFLRQASGYFDERERKLWDLIKGFKYEKEIHRKERYIDGILRTLRTEWKERGQELEPLFVDANSAISLKLDEAKTNHFVGQLIPPWDGAFRPFRGKCLITVSGTLNYHSDYQRNEVQFYPIEDTFQTVKMCLLIFGREWQRDHPKGAYYYFWNMRGIEVDFDKLKTEPPLAPGFVQAVRENIDNWGQTTDMIKANLKAIAFEVPNWKPVQFDL